MDIGLHVLEGSVVTLKLPFIAVEKRKRKIDDSDLITSRNTTTGSESNSNSENTKLEVIGVIRRKIIFKTRPKPTCNVVRNWSINWWNISDTIDFYILLIKSLRKLQIPFQSTGRIYVRLCASFFIHHYFWV